MHKSLLILCLWIAVLACADQPIAALLLDLENQTQALKRESFSAEISPKLSGQADDNLLQTGRAQEQLALEWSTFLTRLQTNSLERKNLLAAVTFSFTGTQTKDNPEPEMGYHFPATITLLRAHVYQGNSAPMANALELSVAHIRLLEHRLIGSHALARAHGLAMIPLAEFEIIYAELHQRLGLIESLFPEFPELAYGAMRDKGGKLIISRISPLLAGFSANASEVFQNSSQNLSAQLSEPQLKQILDAVQMAESTVVDIERYYQTYFPQSFKSGALSHLATAILSVPGLRECINLTRGLSELASATKQPITLSDFEGAACDFNAYEAALNNYVRFYRAQEGWTLLPALVDFFSTFGKSSADPKTFSAELSAFVLAGQNAERNGESDLASRWPQIQKELFSDPETIAKLTRADPLTLTRDLKLALQSAGVPILDGFDVNYSENILQAERLLHNLKQFDKSTPIVSVDSETDCEPFFKGAQSHSLVQPLAQSQSQARTVQVIRQAIIPETAEASSYGFSRLIPLYEVRVGNLMSIQNPEPVPTTLAGLLQTTVIAQLVTNYAQGQLLRGTPLTLLLAELKGTSKAYGFLEFVKSKYHLSNQQSSLDGLLRQVRPMITAEFRVHYRAQLLRAAERLRELDGLITKLNTRGGAASMAPPGLSKILNIPVEYTGEMDRSTTSQYNQTLIDVVGYVRADYFRRHNLKADTRLSIDQFKEQIDWYSGIEKGRVVSRPRTPNFIGHDELKLFLRHPVLQALLNNHVDEILDGPRDLALWTRDMLIARWPMLTYVNPRNANQIDIWRTYKDSDFEKTMDSHLSMIRETAQLILNQNDFEKLLDVTIANRSLTDFVLRRFPDQKLAVCKQVKRIESARLWNARIVGGLSALALGLSLVPEVGPAAALIPGAIAVGMTAAEKSKARIAAAQTHAYQIASLAQRTGAERANDPLYLRSLEDHYFEAQVSHALSIAALATGGTVRFAKMGKLSGSFQQAMRTSKYETVRFFSHGWWPALKSPWQTKLLTSTSRIPGLRLGFKFAQISQRVLKNVGDSLLLQYPLRQLGLTAHLRSDWRLFSELSPHLARWKKIFFRTGHALEDGAHVAVNLPLIPFSAQWGSGAAARYMVAYGFYELTDWSLRAWSSYRDAAFQIAVTQLSQNISSPEADPTTIDLIDSVYRGEFTFNEAAKILEDDSRFHFQESINQVLTELEPNPQLRRKRLLELRSTLSSSPPSHDAIHNRAVSRAIDQIDRQID